MKKLLFNWFCIIITAGWIFPGDLSANSLFQGRRIHLTNEDNRIFTIGVTGTTAGYNYRALIENARQESISLGEFGYWESIDDPPSFLRNYDLQLVIKNNFKGKFTPVFCIPDKEICLIRCNIPGRLSITTVLLKTDRGGSTTAAIATR